MGCKQQPCCEPHEIFTPAECHWVIRAGMLGTQGSEGDLQIMLIATVGRVYACQLITFHPNANRAVWEQEVDLLSIPLISSMLQVIQHGTPLDCAHCGPTEVLQNQQSHANRLKVCELTPLLQQTTLAL